MIHGLDTGFLVVAEIREHSEHSTARTELARTLAKGDQLAIAPQVLNEFIHIVTDSRRFSSPLDMKAATQLAQQWWNAKEVAQVFPDDRTIQQFFTWLNQFGLGRKRLLDTLLAATLWRAGITSILTTNPSDFAFFGVFTCVTPTSTIPP